MQKMSEQKKKKKAAVKEYLEQYSVAVEYSKALDELNTHDRENLTNPSINGRGYNFRTGSTKSEGAASPTIRSESLKPFREKEATKVKKIIDDINFAIGKLEISRGKTILIKNILDGFTEREICRDMKISHDTYQKDRNKAILQLYDILIESDLIDPV